MQLRFSITCPASHDPVMGDLSERATGRHNAGLAHCAAQRCLHQWLVAAATGAATTGRHGLALKQLRHLCFSGQLGVHGRVAR